MLGSVVLVEVPADGSGAARGTAVDYLRRRQKEEKPNGSPAIAEVRQSSSLKGHSRARKDLPHGGRKSPVGGALELALA